jgi:hypothetical protein
MKKVFIYSLFLLLSMGCAGNKRNIVEKKLLQFDLSKEFSLSPDSHGVWSYGYSSKLMAVLLRSRLRFGNPIKMVWRSNRGN